MNSIAPAAFALTAFAAFLATAGCSSPRIGDNAPSLPGACQFMDCVCKADDAAFWQEGETKPIVWLENGQASCPTGFSLKRTVKK